MSKFIIKSLLFDGLYHGDLHAGNILFLENNKIGILDFGIIGELTREEQNEYFEFFNYLKDEDIDSLINNLLHGGVTATGNFNVTAGLATVTFFAIIIAGVKKHGLIKHWKNLVPHGLAWPIYIILIPIELMGLIVKPFALTMRLAANMTGGHIALLALLSLMAIVGEMFHSAAIGIGVAAVSVPMSVAIFGLEIIVVLVQAYVFTLLTAVFVGMAINVHH